MTIAATESIIDEAGLLQLAAQVNETLHGASVAKDRRATVLAALLLDALGEKPPEAETTPSIYIDALNHRIQAVLTAQNASTLAPQLTLTLPREPAARQKLRDALAQCRKLLSRLDLQATMGEGADLLGAFYEAFLKYGNGAKDIGIVLTPRHIAQMGCEMLDIGPSDRVYDPACGTGGFLVAAYDRIRERHPAALDDFRLQQLFGVEQQVPVATLAQVNMLFRGCSVDRILNDSCFSHSPSGITKVLMNPPFALKKDAEKEYRFIEHALDGMVDGGLLFAIVPASVMFAGGANFQWRQRMLQAHRLRAVVSLPEELFYPQAMVECVLVLLEKGQPHAPEDRVAWVRLRDDGYRKKKRQRLPTGDGAELRAVTNKLRAFLVEGRECPAESGIFQFLPVSPEDAKLELIPANYLANPNIDDAMITREMKKVFAEVTLQSIKKGLHDENIGIV